MKTKYSLKNGY